MSNRTEDAQPNELRSNRKGNTAVPIIRATHVKAPGQSFGRSYNYPFAGSYPTTNRDSGGVNNSSSSSKLGGHYARRSPAKLRSTLQKIPSSESATGSERPYKQPRLDTYGSSPFPKQPSPSVHPIGSTNSPREKGEVPSIEHVDIEIPVPCRKGQPDNNRLRNQWLKNETIRIEREQYASVLHNRYIGNSMVRFNIRKLRRPMDHGGSDSNSCTPRGGCPGSSSAKVREHVERGQSLVSLTTVKVEERDVDMTLWQPVSFVKQDPDALTTVKAEQRDVDTDTTLRQPASFAKKDVVAPSAVDESSSKAPSPRNTDISRRQIDFTGLLERSRRLDRRRRPHSVFTEDKQLSANDTVKERSTSTQITGDLSVRDPPPWSSKTPVDSAPTYSRRLRNKVKKEPDICVVTDFSHSDGFTVESAKVHSTLPDSVDSSSVPGPGEGRLSLLPSSPELPNIDVLLEPEAPFDETSDSDIRPLPSDVSDVDELQEVICVPKETHDRPRRLLTGSSLGLLSLTMRGAMNVVSRTTPRKQLSLLTGNEVSGEIIDDACLLTPDGDAVLVLGKNSESESTVIHPFDGHKMGIVSVLYRPREEKRKAGVSAVCPLPRLRSFITGGYDHCIHLWTVPSDDVSASTCRPLTIKHASMIQTLLPLYDTSQKLVSGGADCTVNLWDITSEQTIRSFKTSTSVFHAHVVFSESCVLLEVAHRDLQFELRDYRSTPNKVVQRFGSNANKFNRRHWKGDVHSTQFASGDHDGTVRVWDMRKTDRPFHTTACFPGRRITQVVFEHDQLVVCSEDHHIAFLDS